MSQADHAAPNLTRGRSRPTGIDLVVFLALNTIWNFFFSWAIVGLIITLVNVRTVADLGKQPITAAARRRYSAVVVCTIIGSLLTASLGRAIRQSLLLGGLGDLPTVWWFRIWSKANLRDNWILLLVAAALLIWELYRVSQLDRADEDQDTGTQQATGWLARFSNQPPAAQPQPPAATELVGELDAHSLPQYAPRDAGKSGPAGFGQPPKNFAPPKPKRAPRKPATNTGEFNYGGSIAATVDPTTPAAYDDHGIVQPPASGHLFDPTGDSDFTDYVAQSDIRVTTTDEHQAADVAGEAVAGGVPGKVNLNSANQTQLAALPGVGRVTAKAIIAWRQTNGGFTQVAQLKQVRGVGAKTYEQIVELVEI